MKPKNDPKQAARTPRAPRKSKTAMPSDSFAKRLVEQIRAELPGVLLIAIGDVTSERWRAGHFNMKGVTPKKILAHTAAIVQHKQQTVHALKLASEELSEISFMLSAQLHLIKIMPDGKQFIYLAVDKNSTNLGVARELLRTHSQQLELLPE